MTGYRLSAISYQLSAYDGPCRLAVFDFELAFAPYSCPLWLRLRGSPPVKAFIAEAFSSRIS